MKGGKGGVGEGAPVSSRCVHSPLVVRGKVRFFPHLVGGRRREEWGCTSQQLMCTPTSGQKSKRKRQVSSPPSIPGGREEKGGVGVYQLAADVYTHRW